MPLRTPTIDPRRCRWLGLAGSFALAVGGTAVGALPVGDTGGVLHGHGAVALFLAGFGTALLAAAWLLLGRSVHGPRPPQPRRLAVTLAVWAAPLLLGPPLFSRDAYSYLAQGAMVATGLDPYTHGPADLGGPPAAEIPEVWRHTPAPYGPLFLVLARAVALLTGGGVHAGVLVLRALSLAAVAALAVLLPAAARGFGVEPAAALWLGALNPLVLLHLVAGTHNDALPIALLAGGLLAVQRRHPLLAAALVTLAALVKAPALLALPAVCWLWHRDAPVRLRAAAVGTLAVAAATTVLTTAVAGTGYGWVTALGTPVSDGSWSLTTMLGRWLGALTGQPGAVGATRWAGTAAAALAIAALALAVARRRVDAGHALGLAFTALVLLGPAIRPWYALWALVPIAAAAPRGRVRRWSAAAAAGLALSVMPDGFAPERGELLLMAGGAATAVALAVGAAMTAGIGATAEALPSAQGAR